MNAVCTAVARRYNGSDKKVIIPKLLSYAGPDRVFFSFSFFFFQCVVVSIKLVRCGLLLMMLMVLVLLADVNRGEGCRIRLG